MELTIEQYLKDNGPTTIDTLAQVFQTKRATMAARVKRLVATGKVVNAGPVPNGKKGKNPHTFVV